MIENMDKKFDKLLQSRKLEPANSDLAKRIISAAYSVSQKKHASLAERIQKIFDDILPNPSYALASVLVLGFIVGFSNAPDSDVTSDDDSSEISYVQELLYTDEETI